MVFLFLFRILIFLLPLIALTFSDGELNFEPDDRSTCYGHKKAGGIKAEDHEFPSLVSLQLSSTGHFCAGSIISSNWIITAATCLKGLKADWLNIVAGKDSLIIDEPTKQIRTAERYIVHPNHTEEAVSYNNLALIELTGHFNTNMEEVRPVNLAPKNYKENGTGIACGWRFLPDDLLETGIVRKMNVSLFTVEECLQNYGPDFNVTDKTICTGPVDRKICLSDPGGPLLCKNRGSDGETDDLVLCGVASGEIKSKQQKIPPKLYARISKVRTWIKSVTRI